MNSSPPTHVPVAASAPRPKRSLARWIGKWSLRLLVVTAVTLAVITQAGVLERIVLPRIESALGCKAIAGRVSVSASGLIVVEDLRLSVEGIDSTAATFLQVPRLEVVPRWSGLFSGTIPIEAMRAKSPTIRLSQDAELNLNVARLGGGGRPSVPSFIPGIDLEDAVLDLGEHGPGWYTSLLSLRVTGRLAPISPGSPRYTLDLAESPAVAGTVTAASASPLRIMGELDLEHQTGRMTLDNVDLSRWQRVAMPSNVDQKWGLLGLSGQVNSTVFSYTPKDGPIVSFSVKDVSLNIPIPAESEAERQRSAALGPPRPADAVLEMRRVTGDLRFEQQGMRASLKGLIEDLPCEVTLNMQGYDADSPLTCHIVAEKFTVGDRPRLLPFAPFYVKRNFKRFSGPTAEVSGEVTIRRGEPIGLWAAPLEVLGRIDFEHGEAAFEKFAYPFHDMKGTIVFDETEVRILNITGVGPTGAKMLARGRIAPPTDGGVVEVDVTVADVPVDEHLREAVPLRRRELLEFLFSEGTREELSRLGLLDGPIEFAFVLGGRCTIGVAIRREVGDQSTYQTTIDVDMDRAGLLSKAWAYPVVGEDLSLRITDDRVTVRLPKVRGLSGARASVYADVVLGEGPARDIYNVRVTAADVPCDALLIHSLPGDAGSAPAGSPKALVTALGLEGVIDVTARVFSRDDGSMGYDVHAGLAGVDAHVGGRGCLDLRAVSGDLLVTNEDAHLVGLSGLVGGGEFLVSLAADRSDGPMRAGAEARFDRIPLSFPVEELVALVAPAEGERLRGLRARHGPRGDVTGVLALHPIPAGTDFGLQIDRMQGVSFAIFGGRLALLDPDGSLFIDARGVSTRAFWSRLEFEDRAAGVATLAGEWSFAADRGSVMKLSLLEGRIESPLMRSAAKRAAPRVGEWLERLDARGEFTLEAEASGTADHPVLQGEVVPTSFGLVREGKEIRFGRVSGKIRFGSDGGEVDTLRAEAEGWWLSADGSWLTKPGLEIDVRLGLESEGIPEALAGLLPAEAARAFEASHLAIHGPFALREARVRSVNNGSALSFSAVADCGPSSVVVAVPILLESAQAAIDVIWPLNDRSSPSVRVTLHTPKFEARGIPLTNGRLRLESTAEGGVYELREMSANLHGGSMSATAMVRPAAADTEYSAEIRLLSVDFASLINDLRLEADPKATTIDAPLSRGALDATLTLAGTIGDPASRRGRGVARIAGGEVLALPGAMPLLRLSNLQPPIGEPLESASASFYLQGDTITLDRLRASSESLVILGAGTLRLPSTEVNLRFNTEGRGTIPILDDILRGLRNEIVTTVVTGTIGAPKYRLEAFPSTKRMLGSIFRGSEADASADSVPRIPPKESP